MVNWLQKAIAHYYENSGPITSGHSGLVNKVHRKQNIIFLYAYTLIASRKIHFQYSSVLFCRISQKFILNKSLPYTYHGHLFDIYHVFNMSSSWVSTYNNLIYRKLNIRNWIIYFILCFGFTPSLATHKFRRWRIVIRVDLTFQHIRKICPQLTARCARQFWVFPQQFIFERSMCVISDMGPI